MGFLHITPTPGNRNDKRKKKGKLDIFKELSIRGPHQEVKRCHRMGKNIFKSHTNVSHFIRLCFIVLHAVLLYNRRLVATLLLPDNG